MTFGSVFVQASVYVIESDVYSKICLKVWVRALRMWASLSTGHWIPQGAAASCRRGERALSLPCDSPLCYCVLGTMCIRYNCENGYTVAVITMLQLSLSVMILNQQYYHHYLHSHHSALFITISISIIQLFSLKRSCQQDILFRILNHEEFREAM